MPIDPPSSLDYRPLLSTHEGGGGATRGTEARPDDAAAAGAPFVQDAVVTPVAGFSSDDNRMAMIPQARVVGKDSHQDATTEHQQGGGFFGFSRFARQRGGATGDAAAGPGAGGGGGFGRFRYPEATNVREIPQGDEELSAGYENHNDDVGNVPVAVARWDDRGVRHAFIRKVYLILSVQLLVTFAVCALFALHAPTRSFVLTNGSSLLYSSVILAFAIIFALMCYKRVYPVNMVLLGVFTLALSYLLGTITAIYADIGAGDCILEALGITATIFFALTAFTLQTKWDFSFLGAGLGMSLWALILWGLFGAIFGFQVGSVYALFGTVVFSGYIIFDTYLIAERLDPEDYVIAAIELYLDLVNLFLMILNLLSDRR